MAIRCQMQATGMSIPVAILKFSASPAISGSIPVDANSKSTMILESGGTSRTVASRERAVCSIPASTVYPLRMRRPAIPSASETVRTAMARSTSLVNLGSVRAEMASPPTKA